MQRTAFFNIKGLTEDTPGEDDVSINVGELSHRIIESIRGTEEKIQAVNTCKRKREREDPFIFQPVIDPGPITEIKSQPRKTFIYKERHSQKTPENLRKTWGISLAQKALTLKATTRKLVRLDIITLAHRYRVDRMFMETTCDVKWLLIQCIIYASQYMGINTVKCLVIKTYLLKHILYTINHIVVLLWTSLFDIMFHLIRRYMMFQRSSPNLSHIFGK